MINTQLKTLIAFAIVTLLLGSLVLVLLKEKNELETKAISLRREIAELEVKVMGSQSQLETEKKNVATLTSSMQDERQKREDACLRVAVEASKVIMRASCMFSGRDAECRLPDDIRQSAIDYGREVYTACLE